MKLQKCQTVSNIENYLLNIKYKTLFIMIKIQKLK